MSSNRSRSRILKGASALLSVLLATGFRPSLPAVAAASGPFAGLTRMSSAELAKAHGGFVTPGGLELNIGVQIQTSVNGQVLTIAQSITPAMGSSAPAVSAQLVQVASQGQVSSVVQYATGGNVSTVIQNNADNAVIKQLAQLNITVDNFSRIQAISNRNLSQLMQQVNLGLIRTIR